MIKARLEGIYCTAVLSCIFELNRTFSDDESGLVAEIGQVLHHIVQNIAALASLAREIKESQNNSQTTSEIMKEAV